MSTTDKQKLIITMKKMAKNMEEMLDIINNINEDVNEYIIDDYPFDKSFDEIVCEVGEWVETVEKNINKGDNK